MTRFIEISDQSGKHHLINLSAIASIEDGRKTVTVRFINPAQHPVTLSIGYGSLAAAIKNGDPIVPGGTIL